MQDIIFRIGTNNTYSSLTVTIFSLIRPGRKPHLLKKMCGRGSIVIPIGIPPFPYILERVVVRSTINQYSPFLHPIGYVAVRFRLKRFHVRISHQQHFCVSQRFLIAEVLNVDGLDGYPSFEQRQRLTVEIRQLWVFISVVRRETLEHQGVCHQYAESFASGQFFISQRHTVQGINHHLHLCGIETGNTFFLVAIGTCPI